MSEDASLGSLGQAARGNQLRSARVTLIIIGALTLALNGFLVTQSTKNINDEVAQLRQQGMQVDDTEVAKVIQLNQLVHGGAASLGIVFIGLGLLVYKFPVPCTVAGLALYILANLAFGLLDPKILLSGIIIKILIVAGLFKSVQSALAYQAEQRSLATGTGQSGSQF